jgi:hypothetical protein
MGCQRIDVRGPPLGDTRIDAVPRIIRLNRSLWGAILFRADGKRASVAGKGMRSRRQCQYNGRSSIGYIWRTGSSRLARGSAKSRRTPWWDLVSYQDILSAKLSR